MTFEPLKDTKGAEVPLDSLVEEAATELLVERRHAATTLIKNFLMKVEGLDGEIKNLRNQLKGKEESLAKVQDKINRLKKGDWTVLTENKSASKPDSEHN